MAIDNDITVNVDEGEVYGKVLDIAAATAAATERRKETINECKKPENDLNNENGHSIDNIIKDKN